jgi:DNA-binding CsgD family transcriptional regulator
MTARDSRNTVQPPVALMITPLERAALQLLAGGHGRREIAIHLGLAEHESTLHLMRLFAKMGVSSDRDAITAAARRGLLQPGATFPGSLEAGRSTPSTWPPIHNRIEASFLPSVPAR